MLIAIFLITQIFAFDTVSFFQSFLIPSKPMNGIVFMLFKVWAFLIFKQIVQKSPTNYFNYN